MTNSSHFLGRDVYYEKTSFGDFKKNLSTSKDNMQISLLSLNRNDETWFFDESPARISLKSGVYSGKINGTHNDVDMGMTSRAEFRSKCAGTQPRWLAFELSKSRINVNWIGVTRKIECMNSMI